MPIYSEVTSDFVNLNSFNRNGVFVDSDRAKATMVTINLADESFGDAHRIVCVRVYVYRAKCTCVYVNTCLDHVSKKNQTTLIRPYI